MEGIDSQLPDHFGHTLEYSMGVLTTIIVRCRSQRVH